MNNENANQYALHTTAGCDASVNQTLGQSGVTGSTTCDQNQNFGSGCTVRDSNQASAGEAFNAAGGGVYVAAFEVSASAVVPGVRCLIGVVIAFGSQYLVLQPGPSSVRPRRGEQFD